MSKEEKIKDAVEVDERRLFACATLPKPRPEYDEIVRLYLETHNEKYYRRFSRNTINIAVVGTARQGKSKFLQTVSGLDDRCIPAFPGDHCTGAASIIENSDNENVEVELTFKTNQKLLEEAQSYLDQMTGRQIVLSSVDELPSISRERVNACIETLPEGKKANATVGC